MGKFFLIQLLTLSTLLYAQNIEVDSYEGNYKMTYERVEVTAGEKMGLVGVSSLFDFNKNWYGGATLYGAVDGDRGGFFTVGVDSGLQTELLPNIALKSGAFLGAGGGGAAPQGGGLMFRPYIETSYLNENGALGLGLSHIKFPNGEIESNQLYFFGSLPTNGSFLKGHHFSSAFDKAVSHLMKNSIRVSLLAEQYRPSSSSLNTDGVTKTKDYSLAGIEVTMFHDEHLYNYVQLAGAGSGEADGYMEVFGGLGYQYKIGTLPLYAKAQVGVGAAGGGRVDTGGGASYRAEGGLDLQLTKHLSLGAKVGLIESLKGTFNAQTYSGTVGYTAVLNDSLLNSVNLDNITPYALSVRVINKSYLNSDKLFKNSLKDEQVDLLGFAVDSYLNKNVYLTGQTFWAYDGGAGGYAEGIFGLGYHSDSFLNISLYTEVLVGVGGGGGINIGGGFLSFLGAGVSYDFGNNLNAFVGAAYIQGKDNTFSSTDITYGLKYDFSLLGK